MIYEYVNTPLNELVREAEQDDNRLALAITERFEEKLEQSEQQKRNAIQDELNEYVVQDISEIGTYFINLIKNIIDDKGVKRKTKRHIDDFVNAIENDFSPETQEAFNNMLVGIKKLA